MVNAGMFVVMQLASGIGTTISPAITLLDGVTLSWSQESKQYFPCGSLTANAIFRGPTAWEGSFKRAFTDTNLMGSANVGTNAFVGTIFPAGGTVAPLVSGTILISGGAISNMDREQLDITEEEHKFLIYNMTIA